VLVTVGEVPVRGWPKQFRPDPGFWGPNREDPCPCGSMRRAYSCHSDRNGRWHLEPPDPLIRGARTGYSHPRCYASSAEDCSQKLSNEHWLSANILTSAGDGRPVLVSGMPWQAGAHHQLGARSLGSNMLCERHNGALSSLDVVAGEVFRVLRRYQAALAEDMDPHGHEFALFPGDLLERWTIKLFWGGVAAGTLGHAGAPIMSLRSTVDLKWMADVLFRGEPLPEGWGLYMAGRLGAAFSGEAEVAIAPHTGPDGDLWGGVVEFGAISFRLCLGKLATTETDIAIRRHPQGVLVSRPARDRQKILALSWGDGGSGPIIFTRMANGITKRNPSDL
jgi:hypothetical protein